PARESASVRGRPRRLEDSPPGSGLGALIGRGVAPALADCYAGVCPVAPPVGGGAAMPRGTQTLLLTIVTAGVLAPGAAASDAADARKAVERGVRALRALQLADGTWPHNDIGATALAGLTLLECEVPANDPAVEKAALAVRRVGLRMTGTYALALSVMF